MNERITAEAENQGDGYVTTLPIPTISRFKVFQRDGFRCCLCGASAITDMAVELQVDHIVPQTLGGTRNPDNLCALCRACNTAKGNRLLPEDILWELLHVVANRNNEHCLIDHSKEWDESSWPAVVLRHLGVLHPLARFEDPVAELERRLDLLEPEQSSPVDGGPVR